jgi:hypothetical protein
MHIDGKDFESNSMIVEFLHKERIKNCNVHIDACALTKNAISIRH